MYFQESDRREIYALQTQTLQRVSLPSISSVRRASQPCKDRPGSRRAPAPGAWEAGNLGRTGALPPTGPRDRRTAPGRHNPAAATRTSRPVLRIVKVDPPRPSPLTLCHRLACPGSSSANPWRTSAPLTSPKRCAPSSALTTRDGGGGWFLPGRLANGDGQFGREATAKPASPSERDRVWWGMSLR